MMLVCDVLRSQASSHSKKLNTRAGSELAEIQLCNLRLYQNLWKSELKLLLDIENFRATALHVLSTQAIRVSLLQ